MPSTYITQYGIVEKPYIPDMLYAKSLRRRRRRVKVIVYITWLQMRSGPHSDPGRDNNGDGYLRGFSSAWRTRTWRTRAHRRRLPSRQVCSVCPRTIRPRHSSSRLDDFSHNVPNTSQQSSAAAASEHGSRTE